MYEYCELNFNTFFCKISDIVINSSFPKYPKAGVRLLTDAEQVRESPV